MKKKKGFTLIELLITIGLLVIIGTVIVTNMSGILSENQENQYEEFKKTLENAACTFVEVDKTKKNQCCPSGKCVGHTCSVTLEQVLDKGLIEENDLYNPKTQETELLTKAIQVSYPNGVKTCTFVE